MLWKQFRPSLIYSICHSQWNTLYLFHITFMCGRCLRSLSASTPVKYEYRCNDIEYTKQTKWAKGAFNEGSLSNPLTGSLSPGIIYHRPLPLALTWTSGTNRLEMGSLMFLHAVQVTKYNNFLVDLTEYQLNDRSVRGCDSTSVIMFR